MSRTITVGIDVGSHQTKVVIAEVIKNKGKSSPVILGIGLADSRGALRHGYISNPAETAKSIRNACREAEKVAGVKIKRAYLAVGGIDLSSVTSQSSTIVSRADSEITELDLKKVLDATESGIPATQSQNRKIIHVVPVQYKIDAKAVLGRPLGMHGNKLEVKALFISCFAQHLQDLIHAVEDAGIEIEDVMASPLAGSIVSLTKAQKIAGCVLANIGAETTSIAIFEDNIPISLEIFPLGSNDITNDIALGLKVSLEEAEQIKIGSITSTAYSKKKLDEIIESRLGTIFDSISAHLKKIGKAELLPAGIILTGGGSHITGIEEIAKENLRLPTKVGEITLFGQAPRDLKDSLWSVAYGLCILGFTQGEEESFGMGLVHTTTKGIINWIRQFLP